MKIVSKLALVSLASLALSSTAIAAQQPVVAKLLQVSGKAFVESTDGKRQVARQGMQITEGSHIVLLEKSTIAMNYSGSNCNVTHKQNTLVTVQEAAQCAGGQPMAVGAAGGAAIPPRAIAAGKTAAVSPIVKGMGAGSMGAGSLGAGAGAAGAGSLGLGAAGAAAAILPALGLAGLGLLAYEATKSE